MPIKISLDWLRDFVDLDEPVSELADALTLSGTEVEQAVELGRGWEGVVVGRIAELAPVPGSDHLQVAQLDVGGRQVQVVSGAPNLRLGSLVPYAPPGTELPGGLTIAERRFLKVVSHGMALSSDELGIGGDADGIMDLGTEGEPGLPLESLMPRDVVLIVEVTANRPDELCHLGIARELAAVYDRPLRWPDPRPAEAAAVAGVPVEIADPDLCFRYIARRVEGVTVGSSPAWMQRRLRAVGQRPISNVVDAANYAMLELGQPLHTFDAARLDGGILVRRGRAGEELACLDGKTRPCGQDTLVIADQSRAAALAGVIGGADSAVGPATTTVVIESANFEPTDIRATTRRLGLRTEASSRFEKRLHPELAALGAARLAALLQEVAGAGPSSPPVDVYPAPVAAATVRVPAGFVTARLGEAVDDVEVDALLTRLGCEVSLDGTSLAVSPPPYRLDISIPEDVVEEVGRLRGYNDMAGTLPGRRAPVGRLLPPPDPEWRARDLVAAAGYDEVITPSFSRQDDPADLGGFGGARLELANPMSSEEASLRTTILPALVRTLAANEALGTADARIFELSRVFWPSDGALPEEPRLLALAQASRATGRQAVRRALLELKGAVETVTRRLTGLAPDVVTEPIPGMHPGRSVRLELEGEALGVLGQLHPDLASAFDLAGTAILAEVRFDVVAARLKPPTYAAPSRFPAVVRDLAISVPAATPAAEVRGVVLALEEVILRNVELFDEYTGQQVEPGRKGLALRLTYQSETRTLSGDEVAASEARVAASLSERLGARPRE